MNSTIAIVIGVIFFFLLSFRWVFTFFARSKANQELLRTGTPASGKILSATRTGLEINSQPEMAIVVAVRTDDAPPQTFQVTVKEVVPISSLPQIAPGQDIQIRYQRTSEETTAAVEAFGTSIGSAEAERIIDRSQALMTRLNESGTPGQAIITKFQPLGVTVNGDSPLVELSVKTLGESGGWTSRIQGVFTASGLHKYQVGCELAIRYDPTDREYSTIDLKKTDVVTS